MNAQLLVTSIFALALVGCTTPQPIKGRPDLLSFLVEGQTIREQTLHTLGKTSARFEGESVLTCRLGYEPKNEGYCIVGREADPVQTRLVCAGDRGNAPGRHAARVLRPSS